MKTKKEIKRYLASLELYRDEMLGKDMPNEIDFKIISAVIRSVKYTLEKEHPRLELRPISISKLMQEAKNNKSDQQEINCNSEYHENKRLTIPARKRDPSVLQKLLPGSSSLKSQSTQLPGLNG